MISERKKRLLIFRVIWYVHFNLVFLKSQGLLLHLFILLGSREYTHGECQVMILFR